MTVERQSFILCGENVTGYFDPGSSRRGATSERGGEESGIEKVKGITRDVRSMRLEFVQFL